ncbi:MAG: cytidine deaminase [Kiritimatiellae bacterium]|nr:cytidine deaminase [Kiritimatiellia bacterium]
MFPEDLLRAARTVAENAYAPYSKFTVGAAIMADDGRIFTGCNVENVSFGLTVCAERIALFKAVSEGVRHFTALALCAPESVTPCGACRQVLAEFCEPNLPIALTTGADDTIQMTTLGALFPSPFDTDAL